MAASDLAPAFVRMQYVVSATVHIATYQVQPDGVPVPGVEPDLIKRDTTPITLSAALFAWATVIKPLFNTAVDIQSGEMWYKPTPSSDPIFIYGTSIAVVGTSATATRLSGQYTQTFRSIGGGVLKIALMEPAISPTDSVDSYPYPSGINKAISDYILGATCWIKARDDTFAVTGMRALLKTNDALRKKRLSI